MVPLFNQLKALERDREDASDLAVDALAEVYGAEDVLENCVRDLDAAAAAVDRQNPSLTVQRTIFPSGYGADIKRDGNAQLNALTPLRVRAQPFAVAHPGIAAALTAIDAAEAAFKAALAARVTADGEAARTFAEELEGRRAVRQQLDSAYGRLRDHYKARPALAERYFLKAGTSRAKKVGSKPVAPSPETTPGREQGAGCEAPQTEAASLSEEASARQVVAAASSEGAAASDGKSARGRLARATRGVTEVASAT
ncbi:hypothetical protein [Chondromyces crocatus]|nr:hypothetical protein [Chondromyces crocatus]